MGGGVQDLRGPGPGGKLYSQVPLLSSLETRKGADRPSLGEFYLEDRDP